MVEPLSPALIPSCLAGFADVFAVFTTGLSPMVGSSSALAGLRCPAGVVARRRRLRAGCEVKT